MGVRVDAGEKKKTTPKTESILFENAFNSLQPAAFNFSRTLV